MQVSCFFKIRKQGCVSVRWEETKVWCEDVCRNNRFEDKIVVGGGEERDRVMHDAKVTDSGRK